MTLTMPAQWSLLQWLQRQRFRSPQHLLRLKQFSSNLFSQSLSLPTRTLRSLVNRAKKSILSSRSLRLRTGK